MAMTYLTPAAIAVTGATGVVGGHVARLLSEAGITPRLLVRDPARAPKIRGAQVFAAPYADTAAVRESLSGVDTVFMVSAAESADRVDQHRSFIDAAAAAGVQQVVYTSFLAAAPDAVFTLGRDHAATEDYIKAAGIEWTFLRDNFYMDVMPYFVGDDGVLRGPAGQGRCSIVARVDVARAAAAVLRDPAAHRGRTYDITGPEALNLDEIAAAIGAAQGRPVTFHHETVSEAYESRRRWEAPDWQYDAWVSTYTAIASGDLAPISDNVERLTGCAPISFSSYLASR